MRLSEREDELMIAYQNGDDEALEGIYILLKQSLYSFIFRYTRDEQLSIDIIQDTFVKLQRYKHNYQSKEGKTKIISFSNCISIDDNKIKSSQEMEEPFALSYSDTDRRIPSFRQNDHSGSRCKAP